MNRDKSRIERLCGLADSSRNSQFDMRNLFGILVAKFLRTIDPKGSQLFARL